MRLFPDTVTFPSFPTTCRRFFLPSVLIAVLSSCAGARPRLSDKEIKSMAKEAYQAVRRGDVEVFKGFLDKGLPVNYGRGEETPLHWASSIGNYEIAKLLLDQGADVNARSQILETPLHGAAYYGHTDLVKLLLEHSANPNIGGGINAVSGEKEHETPLFLAAYFRGNREIAELLVAHGADVNAKNYQGIAPIHLALQTEKKPMAEFLIAHGADVNTVEDFERRTPLLEAIGRNYFDIAKDLIRRGADVHVQETHQGDTPLHYAARRKDKELVQLLLEKGADPAVKNKFGRTPLDEALKFGNTEIADLLRKATPLKNKSGVDHENADAQ